MRLTRWRLTFLCALIGFNAFLFCTYSARAGVPQMINYQGTLTDAGGTAVPNGNYDIEFRMYDVASGGASLWVEKWNTTTSQIPVVGGIFNAMLGFQSPIPAGFFADHPVTYLGIKVGTDTEMLPRQQITSVGYAFTAGNGVPKGGVIMWSGSVGTIPAGWALCDGDNGTPDLRDRFVVGAGSGYTVAATGGEASHSLTINEMPSHTHIQDAHTHVQNPHQHQIATSSGDTTGSGYIPNNSTVPTPNVWSENSTATNQSTAATNQNSGSGQAHENRPPYYALAFIMKL